jgi:hypothetical protein
LAVIPRYASSAGLPIILLALLFAIIGLLSFVGGALFMGLLFWGWYSCGCKSVLPTTVAHILTNLFAFTGFLYVNWFA